MKTNHMDELSKQDKITDTLTQEGNSRGIRFSAGRSYYQKNHCFILELKDRYVFRSLIHVGMSFHSREAVTEKAD